MIAALVIVIDVPLQPNLVRALIASVVSISLMAFTLFKFGRRAAPAEGESATAQSQRQTEPDSAITFLRIGFTVLLIFGCLGLVALGTGALMGSVSVGEIWQFLEKTALAEALALGVFCKIRNS